MADKISQLTEVATLTGEEDVPVASQGHTLKFKLKRIAELVSKEDLGLGNVDNTSDLGKPISTAVASALNGKAAASHKHTIDNINGLADALDDKAEVTHSHAILDVSGLSEALLGKADANHGHSIQSVAGLTEALAGKSSSDHTHNKSEVAGLVEDLQAISQAVDSKADALHMHSYLDITGLKAYIEEVAITTSGTGDVSVSKLEW